MMNVTEELYKKLTMNKVASYLQEHLDGEVLTSAAIRKYFSTDSSVLSVEPNMVVYPKTTNDVRKVMRFSWQLAERGHVLPVTARGQGSNQSGAAIGKGIIMTFPAHMNRLLEFDLKQNLARVQPGINYKTFQEVMHTHQRFLPPYPASLAYSTIGGAIANNSSGEKTIKYGDTRRYVDKLEVVLANGELIQTGRINKKELDRKKGQTGLEADIYRHIDGIITDNAEAIKGIGRLRVSKNSSGYALADVKRPDGSFDLTPLIVGSQGTLGIVTEAIIKIEPYSPKTQLLVAEFTDLSTAHDAITELLKLRPSVLEMVDRNLLEFVSKQHANLIKNLVTDVLPAIVLFVEFDDMSERARKVHAKKAMKVLSKFSSRVTQTTDYDEQQKLWGIHCSAAMVVNYNEAGKSALPIIEDGVVPHEEFEAFITGVYKLFAKYRLQVALWGHAGDTNLHMLPLLDLAKMGDRQTVIKLMQEYYDLVLSLGGSISAEHNDGRLRAAFVEKQFGEEMVQVFTEVKHAFDPHGMLNPGVKLGTTLKDLAGILRKDYSVAQLSDYLPRT